MYDVYDRLYGLFYSSIARGRGVRGGGVGVPGWFTINVNVNVRSCLDQQSQSSVSSLCP